MHCVVKYWVYSVGEVMLSQMQAEFLNDSYYNNCLILWFMTKYLQN